MKRSALIGGIVVAAALTMAAPAPAFANEVNIIPWEDAGSVVHEVGEEDWCPADIVDFEVAHSFEASGIDRFTIDRDGTVHFAGTFQAVDTYSANGKTFVIDAHGNFREHKVVDNGDGTVTIWFKTSLQQTVSLDGQLLFHDSGLSEGANLIDQNDTPMDPGDDSIIDVVEEFDLHGRWDTADRGFCEDIATFLGP